MARYRAGAYDKGSKTKGKYTVVEANSAADAVMAVRKYFPGVPLPRFFAVEAEIHERPDNTLHSFVQPRKSKGA